MLSEFYPHRFSPAIWRTVNLAYPLALRINDQVTRLTLSEADWAKLHSLRNRPALLLPNHPSVSEPSVLAGVSRRLGEPFRYVATHEIFPGWRGWVIRSMGTFSIRRGYPDFRSLRMCEHALLRENCKMVMFPEGETHMQNDTVIPCHKGALHVAFRCLNRFAAEGKPVANALPVFPLVIRYRYISDPSPVFDVALSRLESAMGLPTDRGKRLWERARMAALRVLEGVEREYNIRPTTETPVNDRIQAAVRYIEHRIVTLTNVTPPTESAMSLRMRTLYNRVFEYEASLTDGATFYTKQLHQRRLLAVRAAITDMNRLQNFMVAADGMVGGPNASAERIGETIYRLEREVFGESRTHPLREAIVVLGDPWDVSDFYTQWKENRRAGMRAAVEELETRLKTLLAGVLHLSTPASA